MTPISTVKTEDGKVSCETPEGTVVNINITQRSSLYCLLDAIRTFRIIKISGSVTKPSSGSIPSWRLGLGASMMSVGAVSLMLAVILSVVRPDLMIYYTGTHFWVGIPFIISGAVNIVACRSPKIYWEILAFIGVLLNLSSSIAGLVEAITDYNRIYWTIDYRNVCDNLRNKQGRYGIAGPTRDYFQVDYDLSRCRYGFQQFETLMTSLVVMTELLMIWGICLSILALGCRLKAFWSSCRCEKPTEEQNDPLLPPTPTGELLIV